MSSNVTAEIEAAAQAGHHTMSLFKVQLTVANPKQEELHTESIEALVDTGSELTWVPGDFLRAVGITPRRKRNFLTATKQAITRDVGFGIVTAEGFETVDEIVFAEPGDMTLLGVRTLDGFGVMVDPLAHRLVATTTLAAAMNASAQ